MKLLIIHVLVVLTAARPGQLRVPKVYNAVITSNQNLSPSRAFPVIQPVIHRTAVGYVPPFYYTQVGPQLGSPLVHLSQGASPIHGNDEDVRGESSNSNAESADKGEPTDINTEADQNESQEKEARKRNQKEQGPLSFYPNYQSLYYDPYFYTYNGFNPHFVPGTYYVDYQPYGAPEPIPVSTPKNAHSRHLLPGYHEDKKDVPKPKSNSEMEKIPDVPPPPLPTAVPKTS